MRIMIKGGVWKNSEDEILKAAVMKYGKNQWARISSLLVRKSAKQCKARWYEWLDPSIQKTEWTREEEEKLLHLAKIMPTQWRTIAPIVGRTAAQCLDHYEKLLDQAQQAEEAEAAGSSTAGAGEGGNEAGLDDPRKLRPGEIDPTPETKPARPDPVDMDEDEKEMLSEARARLANTRGKKAKRKAREKQLDEAKRLAHLQKRRELLAAGIRVRTFRKGRKDMDYTREIPFEKRPVPGFYDTTEEDAQAHKVRKDSGQVGKLLEKYEGKRRDDIEALERKRDEKRRKIFEEKDMPAALASTEKASELPIRSSKLQLPAPQVSDVELEAIAKAGSASRIASVSTAGGSSATRDLIADYTPSPAQTPVARTGPNEESWEDIKKRELANLRAYHASSSALTGGENTPVAESDFSGVTPRRRASATPNPLVAQTPQSVRSTPHASPVPSIQGSGVTLRTLSNRDGLKINTSEAEASHKAKFALLRRDLLRDLDALPAPKNEYSVFVDDAALPPRDDEDPAEDGASMVEDALDTELRKQKDATARVADMRRRYLSQSARRKLPRPSEERMRSLLSAPRDRTDADKVVEEEVFAVVSRDVAVSALLDAEADDREKAGKAHLVEEFGPGDDLEGLAAADSLVKAEFEASVVEPDESEVVEAMAQLARTVAFSRDSDGSGAVAVDEDDDRAFVAVLATDLATLRSRATALRQHLAKREKKIGLLFRGYEKRREKLLSDLNQAVDREGDATTKLSCFQLLRDREQQAAPTRLANLRALVSAEEERERQLQARYAALADG